MMFGWAEVTGRFAKADTLKNALLKKTQVKGWFGIAETWEHTWCWDGIWMWPQRQWEFKHWFSMFHVRSLHWWLTHPGSSQTALLSFTGGDWRERNWPKYFFWCSGRFLPHSQSQAGLWASQFLMDWTEIADSSVVLIKKTGMQLLIAWLFTFFEPALVKHYHTFTMLGVTDQGWKPNLPHYSLLNISFSQFLQLIFKNVIKGCPDSLTPKLNKVYY